MDDEWVELEKCGVALVRGALVVGGLLSNDVCEHGSVDEVLEELRHSTHVEDSGAVFLKNESRNGHGRRKWVRQHGCELHLCGHNFEWNQRDTAQNASNGR